MESERTHPGSHKYHKYMHIARLTGSSNANKHGWEGITGRVKQLLESQDERVDKRVQRLLESQDVRVEQLLDSKFELLENKMQMILGTLK